MNRKEIDAEILKMGFEGIRKRGRWKFYTLYEPIFPDSEEIPIIGRPIFVLCSGLSYRFASTKEVEDIMGTIEE